MTDNDEYIDDAITSEVKADDNTSSQTKSSRKRGKKTDISIEASELEPVEKIENSDKVVKKAAKSKKPDTPSEMLEKIESRPQIQPPIRVPRVKKSARKKAAKVNTKTINRVVRFF